MAEYFIEYDGRRYSLVNIFESKQFHNLCVSVLVLILTYSSSYQERIRVPGHLSSCECSPEVALKIQFLRLVHSFCDQSDYRVSIVERDYVFHCLNYEK